LNRPNIVTRDTNQVMQLLGEKEGAKGVTPGNEHPTPWQQNEVEENEHAEQESEQNEQQNEQQNEEQNEEQNESPVQQGENESQENEGESESEENEEKQESRTMPDSTRDDTNTAGDENERQGQKEATFTVQNRYSSVPIYLAIKYYALPELLSASDQAALLQETDKLGKLDQRTRDNLDDDTRATMEHLADNIVRAVTRAPSTEAQHMTDNLRRLVQRVALDWSDVGVYIEFVTKDFQNAEIGAAVDELREQEDTLLRTIALADDRVDAVRESLLGMYPLVAYHHDRWGNEFPPNAAPGLFTDYNGSYHLNITLPGTTRESKRSFLERHRAAMLVLQWMEPLFVAVWGQPDLYAFAGSPGLYTRGSYRMLVNSFSSLGTQDVSAAHDDVIEQLARGPLTQRQPDTFPNYVPPLYRLSLYGRITGYTRPDHIGSNFRRDPEKKHFGFEFRILDHFPTAYLTDIVRIVILACDHSYALWVGRRLHALPPDPRMNDVWTDLVLAALEHGWEAHVTWSQLDEFEAALQLPRPLFPRRRQAREETDALSSNGGVTAYRAFRALVGQLWRLYGRPVPSQADAEPRPRGRYSQHMAKTAEGEYYQSAPALININRRASLRAEQFWE